MKRGNAVATCCMAGWVLVLLASRAHADTISISGATPNPVQQGQTLLVALEVGTTAAGLKSSVLAR